MQAIGMGRSVLWTNPGPHESPGGRRGRGDGHAGRGPGRRPRRARALGAAAAAREAGRAPRIDTQDFNFES